MKHKSEPILEVHVELDPAGITELDSELGHVTMIPFSGTVQGPLFSGIVEPCGVDTQVTNCSDVRHMPPGICSQGKTRTAETAVSMLRTTAGSPTAPTPIRSGPCRPLSPILPGWHRICIPAGSAVRAAWRKRGFGSGSMKSEDNRIAHYGKAAADCLPRWLSRVRREARSSEKGPDQKSSVAARSTPSAFLYPARKASKPAASFSSAVSVLDLAPAKTLLSR